MANAQRQMDPGVVQREQEGSVQPENLSETARYKYIHMVKVDEKPKTSVWSVRNNKTGVELGFIRWYGGWRQYIFAPTCPAVYSSGCLEDIARFMREAI